MPVPRAKKDTRTDALIRKVKDHPIVAPVIALAVVIAAVAAFIGQLDNVRRVFGPTNRAHVWK